MNIEISKEDLDFLKELAQEMKNQDRRGTADPYYYVVREEKSVTGMDAAYSSDVVYVDLGSDYQEFATKKAAIESLVKGGFSQEEAKQYFDENFEAFGKFKYEIYHNFFLTYKGYLEHMRLNGHNYSYGINPDTYGPEDDKKGLGGVSSYICHAWRNPEVTRLFEIIRKIGETEDFQPTLVDINGSKYEVKTPTLSYEDIISLINFTPGYSYTMVYSTKGGIYDAGGILRQGKSIDTVANLVICVADTSNA